MQRLLKLIMKYGNFLVFVLLEVVAFFLIIRNNNYPKSSLWSTANSVTSNMYTAISSVKEYFALRNINEALAIENALLRNRLEYIDRQEQPTDSVCTDTVSNWHYLSAEVVQLTIHNQRNFLTINRGEVDSVQVGMGVRNADGAVGVVCTVGEKYAVVLPLIHIQSNLSCRFAKNDYITTLQWDGVDCRLASLTDVATHMMVNRGDTIVTSGLSTAFPEGIPVGIVDKVVLDESAAYYDIQVRLQTNFSTLHYVTVICNEDLEEIQDLDYALD